MTINHSNSKYRFTIPKGSIEILEPFIRENHPKSFETNLVRYLYILDYLHRGITYYRSEVPLHRKYLETILKTNSKNTTNLIKNLIELNIISRVSEPERGISSSRYTITINRVSTLSIPFNVFEHNSTKHIIMKKNQNRLKGQDIHNDILDTEEGNLLLDYLLSISVDPLLLSSILYHPLLSFLSSPYSPPYGGQHQLETQDNSQGTIEEYSSELNTIIAIHRGELFLKRNGNKGRVYNNFTVLARDIRKGLNYQGEKLMALDISNSQPLIFCAFLKKYCDENNIDLPIEEYNKYKSLVEKGVFYEEFMDENDSKPENRQWFKKEFFGSVFYTKVSNIPYRLRKRFRKVFPEIYKIMDGIKNKIGNDGFAILMQEEEARIVWDNVNAPMLLEGYQCFNGYDSIVSHDLETLKEAERRMNIEFNKIGIKPNFKIEQW